MGAVTLTRRQFIVGATATVGSLALGCSLSDIAIPAPTTSLTPTITPLPSPTPSPGPTAPAVPLRRRVARMLVCGFRGRELAADDPILRAVRVDDLGGVILFARNIESAAQLADLTATLRAAAGERTLLIAVDQEGGAVARLGPEDGFGQTPSAAQVGRRGKSDYALEVGRAVADMLAGAGINLNLAPVVDVNVNPDNPSIGALGRSYSADPDIVVEMAAGFIAGHRERGVLTALKHFPGLGSATGDTDRKFVDVSGTWSQRELEPFRQLIDARLTDMVMVGNALNGQLDAHHPSSLSASTGGVMREHLGWDGVSITDDLMAGAIRDSYPSAEALRLAIAAGNDLLLLANTGSRPPDVVPGTLDAIVGLVEKGELDEVLIDRATARIATLLTRTG